MTRDSQPLKLVPMPGADRALAENMRRVEQFTNQRSNPVGGQDAIAAGPGGQQLTATVPSSLSTTGAGDTRVLHRLGRKPTAIVWYQPSSNAVAKLYGHPDGGQAPAGNQTAWDDKAVYVRSDIGSPGTEFVFVVT